MDWIVTTIIIAAFVAMLSSVALGFIFSPWWFLLSIVAFIFFYAG